MHTQHKRACTGMAWSSLRCRLILTTRAGSSKLGSFVLVCIAWGSGQPAEEGEAVGQ